MSQGILNSLEIGGNVFELIEFSLDRHLSNGEKKTGRYGINVAKVREVVRLPEINPLASSIPGIAGVFELRGIPIPAINLAVALGDKEAPLSPHQQIIVTEFSLKRAGFIVRSTERIRRIAWEKVLPPTTDKHTCINGMTLIENNEFLFILDLERILLEIEEKSGFSVSNSLSTYSEWGTAAIPSSSMNSSEQNLAGISPAFTGTNHLPDNSEKMHILLIDDSDLILKNVKIYLERSGYRVTVATDGFIGKAILERLASADSEEHIDVVVTDVEMPKMDGLSLTRWIKEHPVLNQLPVILHTSLSGNANVESGKIVGANGYVVKNDVQMLTALIKEMGTSQKQFNF